MAPNRISIFSTNAWFTEKEKETASTELFSADDFNLHKNASIFNAYKLGKLVSTNDNVPSDSDSIGMVKRPLS